HLEAAFQTDPEHRGVRKNLGYSYAWAGQYEKALDVLAPIPEGESELNVYIWWWGTQGRADLSERAQEMVRLLGEQ
ncbi:MAG: tetratricopeptide repeat protein, partial [Chloroflexota bacterium]